ncbi:MAG: hypothetical protein V8Q84_10330 [Bilophila sp.]
MARKLDPQYPTSSCAPVFSVKWRNCAGSGPTTSVPEDFRETSLGMTQRVLACYLVPRQTIERFVNSIRHES